MAERFDPGHWQKLENPERFEELPPDVVLQLLDLRGDETVVDFGAGTGLYSLPLAQALPHGRLVAVDSSPELLQHLTEKLAQPAHSALRERVTILPYRDSVALATGAADRVLTLNVMHHVYDQPKTLAEIVRLLRPGGRLVVLEFGRIERPVGPPPERVLAHDELRALVASMGLHEMAYFEPGELVPYHVVVVGERPSR